VITWPALVLAALTATVQGTGLPTIAYRSAPPNFAIPGKHGPTYLSSLRGRVVIVDFWASWCEPCKAEMKYFQQAQQLYGDRLAVVTISDELPDVAESYFRTWNIDFPVVEDPSGAIHRLYSVEKIPVTLILSPDGAVSYVSVGGMEWEELKGAIDAAGTPAPGVLP
jgi:thiol-disulfide isomerase/thioredoxin